jgi:ABC-type protease/lipase transport system fused ATPase/permease subunit
VTVFTLQLVQQEPVLFATSIEDNIRFGKPEATPDEVIEAATIANAHEFISQLPERYKTMVGERGVRLSGGQVSPGTAHMTNFYSHSRCNVAETKDRHRASCIAKSALDAESEHLVKEALDRLMAGRTVCIVAHRLSTVRQANVVFVIQSGEIVGQGTHEQLVESNEMYARLVKRQLLAGEPDQQSGGSDHICVHMTSLPAEPVIMSNSIQAQANS